MGRIRSYLLDLSCAQRIALNSANREICDGAQTRLGEVWNLFQVRSYSLHSNTASKIRDLRLTRSIYCTNHKKIGPRPLQHPQPERPHNYSQLQTANK